MPKNFARKTFDAWLEENLHNFKFKPYIYKSRKRSFYLRFFGLDSALIFRISKYGNVEGIIENEQGYMYDIIAEFDLFTDITPEGMYYCCIDPDPIYYPDKRSFWREHAFDEMLKWINKINSDSWIYLCGEPGRTSTSADWRERAIRSNSVYHTCFPLVVDAGEWSPILNGVIEK